MRSALVGVLCCLSLVGVAHAQDAAREAEQLFEEGRKLMSAGRASEACPKFERSQELDPGRGTLINLAACYEQVGRLVDALRVFRDVERQSIPAKDKARLEASQARIAELEQRIPHLTITVADPPEGLVVTVGGRPIEASAWGDVLVDPGNLTIEASAPGHETWKTTLTVMADGQRSALDIPALRPMAAGAGGGDRGPVVIEKTERKNRPRMIAGIATAGVGALLFGGSIVIALGAKADYDDALDMYCGGDPHTCTRMGVDETDAARSMGNLATVVGAVGLAAIAGGVYLWITAPTETVEVRRDAALVPVISADGAGVALSGRW